jgi:plasmid maintenance system antidote protein VapI
MKVSKKRMLVSLIKMYYGTQLKFAKKLKITSPKLSLIINGHEEADDKLKDRMAKLLGGCKVSEIF